MANDGTIVIGTELDDSGLKSGLGRVGSIASSGLKAAGIAISAVSAGLVAAGTAAVKVGSDFEAGMSTVAAISGATAEELAQLEDKAREMGAATKFSATEAASAMEYMAMAGWKTGDMLEGVEGIMDLAAASGEDLALTSDIVTDALTAFGLQAQDSAHFADVLAKASSSSNTNVAMMGVTFQYVAPLAGAMGYSIEDTAVAIGLMANAGIKGEKAGTALRSMFTRLVDPPKEAAEALATLGIEAQNADGSMKPLSEMMVDLRGAFSGLTDAQKTQYAAAIAGTEGMSGFLNIVNAGEADFQALTEQIGNADGAAKKMAAIRLDNLQGDVELLKSGLSELGIAAYKGAQGPLREMVQLATQAVGQLNDAFKKGGFEGLVSSLGTVLAQGINVIVGYVPQLTQAAVSLISAFLQGIIDNLPGITTAALSVVTALVEALIALAPQILQAGITILITLAQGLSETLPELIPVAIDAIFTLIDTLLDNIDALVDAGIELTFALAEGLIDALPRLLEKAPEIVTKLVEAIVRNAPKLLTAAGQLITKLIEGIVNNLGNLGQVAGRMVMTIVEGVLNLNARMLEAGRNVIRGLWDGMWSLNDWLLKNVYGLLDGMLDGIKDFFGIHSPSTVMRDVIGKNLVRGIGAGIEVETPEAVRTLEALGNRLVSAANSAPLLRDTTAATAAQSSVSNSSSFGMGGVTINWYGGGEDADVQAISRRLGQLTERQIRQKGILYG